MLEERRQFPRLVPSTPLFVSMDDAKSGLLLDLCEGGLAVASLVPRNLDDVVSLAFDLPEGVGHIEAKAQIAWTRDSGHLTGVRFMDLDEVSQQQLCEWIAAGTNLKPAGSEEIDEPVIVTRSTYAQVDAIRREIRPETRLDMLKRMRPEIAKETQPHVEMRGAEANVVEPIPAAEMAIDTVSEPESIEVPEGSTAVPTSTGEMTGELFPERTAEEQLFAEEMAEVEMKDRAQPLTAAEIEEESYVFGEEVSEQATVEEPAAAVQSAAAEEPAAGEPTMPGSTSRAEWVEHMAQMEVEPPNAFDAGSHPLPPDAETVGWASDAVGWVQEIAEKRITAPEEVEFDGVFVPETAMGTKAGRSAKSRHTIELVLAVVLLTWALVFLGYQMGSTGVNRTAHDLSLPKAPGGTAVPANAGTKGQPGKAGAPSTASFASVEEFPEMSPVPPISGGRSSMSASNSAAFETPGPLPSRSMAAAPKTPTPAPREAAKPPAETTILAGPVPAMNSGVVLQVGAMKMQGNATALMQDLKKKKFSAFVYRHGSDNLYRVGVGPFGDKDSTARVKSELQKNGYTSITAKWAKDKG